jgi:hypothetical protein
VSDAKVEFHPLDYGKDDRATFETGARFSFRCPKGRRCHGLLIAGRSGLKRDGHGANGGVPQWDLSGTPDAPTFHPSINCKGCWHGFIEKGRCVSTAKVDEPEPQQ